MNWAFELLGLRPDVEVADVKRAYARMLRTTRPDDDPEAFQRLHAAYKLVLAQVGSHSTFATRQVATETASELRSETKPVPPPFPQPAHAQTTVAMAATPSVNLDALTNEVIRTATQANDELTLSNWLHTRQDFWSIQVKQQCGHRVLNRLFQQPQAISAECMDTLLHFFDLNHVLSGINPLALKTLRHRQMTLWELLPANHHVLSEQIGYPNVKSFRKDLTLLQQPFSWTRTLAASIGRARGIGHLISALLGDGGIEELPSSINRRQAIFWVRATTRGPMTWPRFTMRSVQVGLAALACALLVSVIYSLHVFAPVNPLTPSRIDIPATLKAFATTWIVVSATWLIFAGTISFDQWQGQPESAPSRWPWLRRLAIPAMCIAGLAAYEIGDTPYMAGLIVLCFIFALRKFRRRSAVPGGFFWRITSSTRALIWIGVTTVSTLSRMQDMKDFPFFPALALVAFAMSIADLWRHRAYLHPKLARN